MKSKKTKDEKMEYGLPKLPKDEGYGFPEPEPHHNIEILLNLEYSSYKAIAKCKLCNKLWRIFSNGVFERIKLGSCPK